MTKHDLIQKVGGTERAREILEGAPSWARSYFFGIEQYESGDFSKSYVDCISINDLRTAITSHKPKFKVGDLVVFDTTKPFCTKLPNDLMEYQQVSPNSKHDAIVWVGERMFEVGSKSIRHATPSEIAAGHRIELSGNTGQLEVLDMIHVSPSCEVIDYE